MCKDKDPIEEVMEWFDSSIPGLPKEADLSWMAKNKIPEKINDFVCPQCGCMDYEQFVKSNHVNGPGGRPWVEKCVCRGCTAHFSDPKKFMEEGRKFKSFLTLLEECKKDNHHFETELVRFEEGNIEFHAEWCVVCGSVVVDKFIGGNKAPGILEKSTLFRKFEGEK